MTATLQQFKYWLSCNSRNLKSYELQIMENMQQELEKLQSLYAGIKYEFDKQQEEKFNDR